MELIAAMGSPCSLLASSGVSLSAVMWIAGIALAVLVVGGPFFALMYVIFVRGVSDRRRVLLVVGFYVVLVVLRCIPYIPGSLGIISVGKMWIVLAGGATLCSILVIVNVFAGSDKRCPEHGCVVCGYDLTLNESGRCPECGADVIEA